MRLPSYRSLSVGPTKELTDSSFPGLLFWLALESTLSTRCLGLICGVTLWFIEAMDRSQRVGEAIIAIGRGMDGKGLVTLQSRRSPSSLEEIGYQGVVRYPPAS